jgi:hypothetical protein
MFSVTFNASIICLYITILSYSLLTTYGHTDLLSILWIYVYTHMCLALLYIKPANNRIINVSVLRQFKFHISSSPFYPVPSGAVGKDCQRRLLSRPRFVGACSATDLFLFSSPF